MARFNDFMTQIDFSALKDYLAEHGRIVTYAKGDRMVQEGQRCRHIGIVISGYFKYVALNTKGQEIVTGFSFEGEVVTDYVRGFLCGEPCMTSIVAGCDAQVLRAPIDTSRCHLMESYPYVVSDATSRLLQEAYRLYLDVLVKTPSERYRELIVRYPGMIFQLPVQEVASYLGVSRRQLQRIRETENGADTGFAR